MPWSEDRIHRWLDGLERPRVLAGASGHDAAVLRADRGREVACCDQVIVGVHVGEDTPLLKAGAKAAGRALSDLAATSARPRALLCALRAPEGATDLDIRQALKGVMGEGQRHGAPLVGGDLALASGPLSLAVTALGSFPESVRPPARSRARAGQRLILTGPVGGSGLGRHMKIEPRLPEGRALFGAGATALMDVSDGLAWDLFRLARSAGVGIVLEAVPIHPHAVRAARASGRTALDHALHDGEDHELIAALSRPAARKVLARQAGWSDIGRVVPGAGLQLELDGGPVRPWKPGEGGWKHGA